MSEQAPNAPIKTAPDAAGETRPSEDMPPAPQSPYRSSAQRARVVIWLLAISTIVAAVAVAANVYGFNLVQKAIDGSLTDLEARRFLDASNAINVAILLTFVATAVAFLAWLSRAIDNVPALGGGRPSASPRWAIAWWFIPFANLGMPYDVIRELRGRLRGDRRRQHPPLLLAWWFAFVGSEAVAFAATRMPIAALPQQSAALIVNAIGAALTVCAGVLAILVVRGIEQAAAVRAATPEPYEPADWDAGAQRTGWRMRPSWVGFVAIPAAAAVGIAVPLLAPRADVATHPHEAPELEARLPGVVAGELLDRWSVRGEDYYVTVLGVGASDLAQAKADLATAGLTIDDVAFATAGRTYLEDPPYFIVALQVRGITADTIPDATLIDHPEVGTFTRDVIAGKSVKRGTAGMLIQSANVRGIPYLYDIGDIRFIVVTDDPDWAADALGQLP